MTEEELDHSIERVRLELVTRKFMVTVLAMIAVWVGIAIMLTGAPNFIEDWFSPWSRYCVGGVAFFSGIVTSIGGLEGDETKAGWRIQVIGLTTLTLWYLCMSAAYVGLVTMQGLPIVAPGEPLPDGVTGRGYVPIVYAGLMVMTATPLATLFRLGSPDHRLGV